VAIITTNIGSILSAVAVVIIIAVGTGNMKDSRIATINTPIAPFSAIKSLEKFVNCSNILKVLIFISGIHNNIHGN